MTERDYLDGYDPRAFPAVAVAVDLVVATLAEQALRVAVFRRAEQPARGKWALPGGIVRADEDLDACARRVLREKVGLDAPRVLRQFAAFGAPDRDPRMRMVSIGYVAMLPATAVTGLMRDDLTLATVRWGQDTPSLVNPTGRKLSLAFDHDAIAADALNGLRTELNRTPDVFGLLEEAFTLRDLQAVHEAVRGETIKKPAFRTRMLEGSRDRSWELLATGEKETASGFRPAELYRMRLK